MYDPSSVSEKGFYIPLGTWVSSKPGHSPSEVEAGRIMQVNFKRLLPLWLETMVKEGTYDSETLNRWLNVGSSWTSSVRSASLSDHGRRPRLKKWMK